MTPPTYNAEPPFRYCRLTRKVMGASRKGGETVVCDVRGWGYLSGCGQGALALEDEVADQIIHRTGEHIAALLNDAVPK